MKRIISLLCMAIAIIAWQPPQLWAQTQPTGGGSFEDPFLITTAEELKWYADYVNGESGDGVVHNTACAKLMNDIDLSSVCGEGKGNWTPIAKEGVYNFNQDPYFEGTFDGNGFTIDNLYINQTDGEYLALFGLIKPSTQKVSIQNLKLKNVYVAGREEVASLCAYAYYWVTIKDIEAVSGDIIATNSVASGIAKGGKIKKCVNRANVTCGNIYAAGINCYPSEVTDCSNYGKITSTGGITGGICSRTDGGVKVTNCANYGDITITNNSTSDQYAVGGIIGTPWYTILNNCANFGNIYLNSASDYVGVIAGSRPIRQADGILANTGKIYVNGIEQTDVPVLQSNIQWENENSNNATCITPTDWDLTSGHLAYELQQNCTEPTWGQNITTDPKDAYPIIGGATVYVETSCTNSEPTGFSNNADIVNHNTTHHDGVAATCTEAGSIEYWSCSDCGKMWSDEALTTLVEETTLATLGHTKDQEVAAAEPTCTTAGNTAYYHCSTCNKYYNADTNEEIAENAWVISAKGHSTELNHVAAKTATCTEKGNFEYWYCSDCQTYFWQETCENAFTDDDDATTGVWIAMVPHTMPTDFDENGLKYCSVCDYIDGEAPTLVTDESSAFNGYYAISKAAHLVWMHNQLQVHNEEDDTYPNESIKCYLAQDISLSPVCHPAKGDAAEASWNPIGDKYPFKGVFDGNGMTISDLYINSSDQYVGLFSKLLDGGEIKNLTVVGDVTTTSVEGKTYSGAYAGIVLGYGYNAKITNCQAKGSVKGPQYLGGVIGSIFGNSQVVSCNNYASIVGTEAGGRNVGGVAGSGVGMSRCSNYGEVTSVGSSVGGVAGSVTPGQNNEGFTDCMNTANVTGRSEVGGLVGTCYAPNNKNSFSTGKVTATESGAGLVAGNYGNDPSKAFYNVYYVEGDAVTENGVQKVNQYNGGSSTLQTLPTAISPAEVANGKLAYLLQQNAGEGVTWGQQLATQANPVLGGATIYFAGKVLCNGIILKENYTNDAAQAVVIPAHSQEYEDGGFCTVCHESRDLHGTGTASDPYLISSVAQLEQFRDKTNTGEYTAHAKLVNDIDLSYSSNDSWTPISKSDGYKGTFDGNGYSVKNLSSAFNQGGYLGFVGQLYEGTIKNLTVEGNLKSSCYSQGMIAGYVVGGTIIDCVARGTIQSTGASYVGGISGYVSNTNLTPTFDGCTNYVSVASSTAGYAGGIIGQSVGTKIKVTKCANFGNVTNTCNVACALVGYVAPDAGKVISDCYVGPCEVRGNSAQTFLIALEPSGSQTTFDNIVYSNEAKVYTAASATEPAELTDHICYGDYNTSSAFIGLSNEQINRGEAAYLLNHGINGQSTWTQDLSQSSSQPMLHGDVDAYGVYLMGYAHGETMRSYCNDPAKKNSLHAAADDNGSHDNAYTYTSNGNSTHDAICSVCQHEEHGESCLFGMADQTCAKCLYALLDDITIEDEEVYARANTANVSNLTYNRTFKGTNWTTWYVPFELTLTAELCEKYAFSRINNVHQYDDNNDGAADRTIVESFKQTEGMTLKANYPYLVRALTDADKSMTVNLDNVTLNKAEDKSIECMSIDYVYTFKGTYQGVGESGTEADSPLSLFDYSDENKWYNFHSLPAQRHFLTITPRNGSTALHAPARVMLQVIGEETSTGIVNLYNVEKRSTETYDLSGRRVNNNQRGLLIKNGKKVIIK